MHPGNANQNITNKQKSFDPKHMTTSDGETGETCSTISFIQTTQTCLTKYLSRTLD